MPGLVKIGRTDRQPEDRVRELESTGVPTPFKLEFSAYVSDSVMAEAQIHRVLEQSGCRTSQRREFFKISLHEAVIIAQEVSGLFSSEVGAPDFSMQFALADAFAQVRKPGYEEKISEQHAVALELRLASIGRQGLPYSLKSIAEIYERNFRSSLKFRAYWQEFLELGREEAYWWPLVSTNGRQKRNAIGREAAEYLDRLARNNWLVEVDFEFVQNWLISGCQFTYEGYVEAVERADFSPSIRQKALNL